MAWVEKLGSGRYRGMYRDAQGRRRSTGRDTFAHKAPALRAATKLEVTARRRHGVDPNESKRPWSEWAREVWWPSRDVEPGTLMRDESRMRKYLEPEWGQVPLGQITKIDVRDWLVRLKRAGVSNSTRNRVLRLFSASMRYATERDVVDANPCTGIRAATETKGVERFLTREEFGAIVEQLPTQRDQQIAIALVFTGMRWGELAGLHWQRVDMAAGQIGVNETYSEETGTIKAYPKGKKMRHLPLTPGLRAQLAGMDQSGESCGVEHVSGRCRSGLVFTSERGAALRNSKWQRVWKSAVVAAGLSGVRINDLRHTYASWLLQAGVPIAEVSKLLGHASISTTERYAHLSAVPSDAVLAALAIHLPYELES